MDRNDQVLLTVLLLVLVLEILPGLYLNILRTEEILQFWGKNETKMK